MNRSKTFNRHIGSKLATVLDASASDAKRRQKYRRWIWCSKDDVLVSVTISVDPQLIDTGKKKGLPGPQKLRDLLKRNDAAIRRRHPHSFVEARARGNQIRAVLMSQKVSEVAAIDGVWFVGVSDSLKLVAPVPQAVSLTVDQAQDVFPKEEGPNILGERGTGKVLLGFIDVEGFDFSHPAFLDDAGQTRFVRIWDQTDTSKMRTPSSAAAPAGFKYGHDFNRDLMNRALAHPFAPGWAYFSADMPTHVFGSHGTHVASVAGGTGMGVCGNAYLAGVVYSQGPGANEPTGSARARADSERLHDAVAYLKGVARDLGEDGKPMPLVINISLGRNGGAHDGSAAICREIEAQTSGSGLCVVVAAGNAGDSTEIGGRIHEGSELRRDAPTTLVWRVENADSTDNELEIWYDVHDKVTVSVTPPGEPVLPPVVADSDSKTKLSDDTSVYVYHTSYDRGNGCNYIYIQLSPKAGTAGAVVKPGDWQIKLSAAASKAESGPFHAWIERDDEENILHRQSYFVGDNLADFDNTKINSLACGVNTIAVANWDTHKSCLNPTSSQGPTRDMRNKPDIAAPGTNIWGANGFLIQDGDELDGSGSPSARLYSCKTGTSLSTPYVSGVAALMLQINPTLTASQIRAIMTRKADAHGQAWLRTEGYGLINPEECLLEARRLRDVP